MSDPRKSNAPDAILDGFTPVRVNGSRELGAKAGYYQAELADGTAGYMMRRTDDCLRASIATLLQIPTHQVPDLPIDDWLRAGVDPDEIQALTWRTMIKWATRVGVVIVVHPVPPRTGRWIGVQSSDVLFSGHSFVMKNREVMHNPFRFALLQHTSPQRFRLAETLGFTPEDVDADDESVPEIDYGITLRKD